MDSKQETQATPSVGPSVGSVLLERYRLEEHLGTGPFASVFSAADLELKGAKVSVKCFHPHLTLSEQVRLELRNRALLMRQLTHGNILRTFDLEQGEREEYYLVSELCDGWSLSALLDERRQRPLRLETGLYLLNSILGALGYAHKRGVLHLNLKPSNVLISRTGEVKVCDFSLNGAFDAADGFTATGESVTSPFFMAPEQFSHTGVSEQTDLYAWAILSFQVLCGGSSQQSRDYLECARTHVAGDLPTLFRQDGLPLWLSQLLSQCSEKEPSKRPQGVEAIRTVFADNQALNDSTGRLRESLFPSQRRRSTQFLVLLIVCFATAITACIVVMAQESSRNVSSALLFWTEMRSGIQFTALKRLADINYDPRDPAVLHHAIANHDLFAVEALLRAGVAQTALDAEGRPPLISLGQQFPGRIDNDLSYFDDLNQRDAEGRTLVHLLVRDQNVEVLEELLRSGANADVVDKYGDTPLILASKLEQIPEIRTLLPYVRFINQRDFEGRTAIMWALTHFSTEERLIEMLTLLLEHGADPNAVDNYGRTTRAYAEAPGSHKVVALLEQYGMRKLQPAPDPLQGVKASR